MGIRSYIKQPTESTVWYGSNVNRGLINEPGLVLRLDAADSRSYPGSGTTWYDLSPNGNNATLLNSVSFDGDSFDFDGSNDYATIGTSGFPFGSSPGTLSVWARTYSTTATWKTIVSYGNPANGQTRFLGINGTTYYFGAGNSDITASGVVQNAWFNMVGVYDGTNASMYINGTLVSGPTARSWNTVANNAQLGRQTDGARYWDGNIAIVSIYDRVVSSSQIQERFNLLRGRYGI